jgi:SAM-dependent methyltransferase
MKFNFLIKKVIYEKGLEGLIPGTVDFFNEQRSIINRKPLLKKSYLEFYRNFKSDVATVPSLTNGKVLELGSGGGFLKSYLVDIITSDVYEQVADLKIDAQQLPFADGEVRAIFMASVLHHIPNVKAFFCEADRVLTKGGVCAIIEPSNTLFAKFFYAKLHHEPFLPHAKHWEFTQNDAMLDSNQALSWIVFERDIDVFRSEFPNLIIEKKYFLSTWEYFFSGGVNYSALVPSFMYSAITILAYILRPLDRFFSLSWYILIRKT